MFKLALHTSPTGFENLSDFFNILTFSNLYKIHFAKYLRFLYLPEIHGACNAPKKSTLYIA